MHWTSRVCAMSWSLSFSSFACARLWFASRLHESTRRALAPGTVATCNYANEGEENCQRGAWNETETSGTCAPLEQQVELHADAVRGEVGLVDAALPEAHHLQHLLVVRLHRRDEVLHRFDRVLRLLRRALHSTRHRAVHQVKRDRTLHAEHKQHPRLVNANTFNNIDLQSVSRQLRNSKLTP